MVTRLMRRRISLRALPLLLALLIAFLMAFLIVPAAEAVCLFNNSGTITNPNDPSCRDAQFRYTRSDNSGSNVALGYDVPLPVDSLTAVDGFRSYQSLFEQHQALDSGSASVSGQIVGQTLGGRDIWAYVVGDADTTTADGSQEAAAMINGTIHAREWQSPEALTEIYEQLVETQDDGGFGQYLSENLTVLLLPVLNVDGFLQTQRFPDRFTASEAQPRDGRMRRKNLRHSNPALVVDVDIDTTDDNFFGVDLNRNNLDGWGLNGGSSNNPVSLVYRGPVTQSEPEIQALIAAAALGPAARLRLYADLHSFSQVFIAPLTGNTRRDAITTALASRMRAASGNRYGYSVASGSGIGLTSDYFARQFQIPSWTLEIEPLTGGVDYGGTGHQHSGFVLPNNQVARMRNEIAAMLLAGLYRQADPPRVQALELRDEASGELRYAASWVPDAAGRRLQTSVDKALVSGRSYRLWLAFNKPMRWRNQAGAVSNYPGQTVPAFPNLVLQFTSLSDASSDQTISGTGADWLEVPGNDGDGYLRYRDDALTVSFTVPAAVPAGSSLPAVLAVQATDITISQLDSDPSTVVDWSAGHWIGYEDENGNQADIGGRDCNFVVYVSTDENAAPPANRDPGCRVAQAPAPPPPAPAPAPNPGGGGGGGLMLWLLPVLAMLARRQHRRRGSH